MKNEELDVGCRSGGRRVGHGSGDSPGSRVWYLCARTGRLTFRPALEPGHVWVAGYQANGYWIPGRWNFIGGHEHGPFAHFDRGPAFDRHFVRDHDRFRR